MVELKEGKKNYSSTPLSTHAMSEVAPYLSEAPQELYSQRY